MSACVGVRADLCLYFVCWNPPFISAVLFLWCLLCLLLCHVFCSTPCLKLPKYLHDCACRGKPMGAAMVSRGLPWEPQWNPTVFHVGVHGRLWAPMGSHGMPRDPAWEHVWYTVEDSAVGFTVWIPAGVPPATSAAHHTCSHAGCHGIPVTS